MTPRPPQAPPGLLVGGYSLLTRIGEGGMGVVHLAQQPGGERVALKVLRPHIVGDDEARARLAREVNSLSRIRSPRVAEIVDADPWGPVPFVATRYVPGLSLHDHVHEEGPIGGRDLTWFAGCLADALAAVHQCGVLHRDIKPANVLMEGRSPVLIDFGLARVADDPKLTHTGWLLGTPGYLAPEILYGENASTASDVHSWAATVAYAGTGRAPFGRGPAMAIMDRVRRGEHQLDGLPAPIRPLIAAALDPTPTRRPTLPQIQAQLQALANPVAPAVAPAPEATPVSDDPFTLPLAWVAASSAQAVTDPLTVAPTRVETDYSAGPFEMVPVESKPSLAVRARRGALIAALALAAAGLVAALPMIGTTALVLAAWLLRSGSLATSAAGQRRRIRGQKWYDAPQVALATPWHLMQSTPATFMLVLWAGGLALAGLMLAWSAHARWPMMLAVAGFLLAGALWLGPGGSRVRGPLRRVIDPICDRPLPWAVSVLLVLALAAGAGAVATTEGPAWEPLQGPPLSGR